VPALWQPANIIADVKRGCHASGVYQDLEACRLEGQLFDQFRSFQDILHPIIRRLFQCFLISPINKNGFAARIEPTVYVSPSTRVLLFGMVRQFFSIIGRRLLNTEFFCRD